MELLWREFLQHRIEKSIFGQNRFEEKLKNCFKKSLSAEKHNQGYVSSVKEAAQKSPNLYTSLGHICIMQRLPLQSSSLRVSAQIWKWKLCQILHDITNIARIANAVQVIL